MPIPTNVTAAGFAGDPVLVPVLVPVPPGTDVPGPPVPQFRTQPPGMVTGGVGLTGGDGRQRFNTGRHGGPGVGVAVGPAVGVGVGRQMPSRQVGVGVGGGVGVGEIRHVGSGEHTGGGVGTDVGGGLAGGDGGGGSVIKGGSVMTGVGGSVITGVGGKHGRSPQGVWAFELCSGTVEDVVLAAAIRPIPTLDIAKTTAAASPPITQRGQPGLPRRLM
ncbi:MAG TPA: hypothetical protein VII79_08960 [Candidatus Dormibacteraeota bacterium]